MADYIPLNSASTRLSPGPNLRPFNSPQLSPSTSSERELPHTRDLISKLDKPIRLVQLVQDKGGAFEWKVTEKKITASDIDAQQNRLMFRKKDILENLIPSMTRGEIEEANLASRLRICGGGDQAVRRRGEPHEGLEVNVYNTNGLECSLLLTRWDSNESPVLKGPNYKVLRNHLASRNLVGKLVEMWAFRNGDGNLCFVIEEKP